MNNDTAKPDNKNRQKKQVIVAEVSDKVAKAKVMVFTNYQGMTHRQLEEFKKSLRKVDAELMITKNTLLKRALEGKSVKGKGESEQKDLTLNASPLTLQGPTATIFGYEDPIAPLKELAKIIKTLQLPKIKMGIFENKAVTEAEITKLSTLPSREVLIAQFVGGLKSPLYGLHRALSRNLTKFVMTLKAIESTKSATSNQPSATS